MNTIATPAALHASITSGSRREPPGWITAVTPASIAASTPSANGKKASEASAEPWSHSGLFARAFSTASRTESTRLICPAPMPIVARPLASTIAFERTCLQTLHAN